MHLCESASGTKSKGMSRRQSNPEWTFKLITISSTFATGKLSRASRFHAVLSTTRTVLIAIGKYYLHLGLVGINAPYHGRMCTILKLDGTGFQTLPGAFSVVHTDKGIQESDPQYPKGSVYCLSDVFDLTILIGLMQK